MVNSAILAEERKCQKNILEGEEQGFIEIWYNRHLSGQTLVSQQTIGLTEQLDQHQLEIILSFTYDLRALPLCYFYGVTQQFLIYIIGK